MRELFAKSSIGNWKIKSRNLEKEKRASRVLAGCCETLNKKWERINRSVPHCITNLLKMQEEEKKKCQ